MPRTAASFTQSDVARAIRAAKQAGASEVEVRTKDGASVIIRLGQPSTGESAPLAPAGEIVL